MSIAIKNTESNLISCIAIKCGLMVIVPMIAYYLGFTYAAEVKSGLISFFKLIDPYVLSSVVLMDKIPLIPTILLCGFYGWLQCVSINLERRKIYHKYMHFVHNAVMIFALLSYFVVLSHSCMESPIVGVIGYVVCSTLIIFSAFRTDRSLKKLKKMKKDRDGSAPAEAV